MKKQILLRLFCFVLIFGALKVTAEPLDKQKSNKNSTEKKHDYEEAVKALKKQVFLVSFYSFVDKTGNLVELEPEGNFILINTDKAILQKSVSLISNTFPGSSNFKGVCSNYHFKESRKGNVIFSFVISDGKRGVSFKGKMNRADNLIEGTIKGKIETSEIVIIGNIQPVQAHFVY